MRGLFCIVYLVAASLCFGQQPVPRDSIIRQIRRAADDTGKAHLMYRLSQQYLKTQWDSAYLYASGALDIYRQYKHETGILNASLNLGYLSAMKGDYDQSKKHLNRALRIAESRGSRKMELKIAGNLANIERLEGDSEKAGQLYKKLIEAAKELGDSAKVAKNLHNLALVYEDLGKTEEAIENYQKALQVGRAVKAYEPMTNSLNNLAHLYRNAGKYSKAESYNKEALELAKRIQNKKMIAMSLHGLGQTYSRSRRFDKTLEQYERALDFFEQINSQRDMANILTDMASVHKALGNYEMALDYFRRALALAEASRSLHTKGRILNNIGKLHESLGAYEKALDYHKQSLAVKRKGKDYKDISNSLANLANIFISLGEVEKAIPYIEEALEVSQKMGFKRKEAYVYSIRGRYYQERGVYEKAGKDLKKALHLYRSVNDVDGIKTVLTTLSAFYSSLGQYEQAWKYQAALGKQKDSIYTDIHSKRISELEARYWSEKKESDLLLAKKNEEILAKEKARYVLQRNSLIIGIILLVGFGFVIYRLNMHKKKSKLLQRLSEMELKFIRSQMNPHFLFNVLSAIQYLVNNKNIKTAHLSLAKFGRLMRMILENSEKEWISIEDELTSLQLYIELEALRFQFDYRIETDNVVKGEAIRIPPMLIQPYVENAIKHGISKKKEKGHLYVSLKKEAQSLLCVVEDDGIGRKQSQLLKSKQLAHHSMGMRLTADRLERLQERQEQKNKALIKDLYDEKGSAAGTRVEITIPFTLDDY